MNIYKDMWEASYLRKENNILFPKEQCVKFLSRFVSKSNSYFSSDVSGLLALDFGCGIGTQTNLLADFGFSPIGVDISETAIHKARELYPNLASSFQIIDGNGELPFTSDSFSIVLAESVLDSMSFDIALKSILEIDRVVNGLAFISLIVKKNNKLMEEVVDTKHEFGTVQSYFDDEKLEALLSSTSFNIIQKYVITETDMINNHIVDSRIFLVLSNME